jgi:hypothetical protein
MEFSRSVMPKTPSVLIWGQNHLTSVPMVASKSLKHSPGTNAARTRRALDKDAPLWRPVQRVGRISHAMAVAFDHSSANVE